MRYSPRVPRVTVPRTPTRVTAPRTPSKTPFSRVYVETSTSKRASPVERRIHEKRLLAKIIETRKRRLALEEIYKLYLKYIKTMENELRIQEREMQKAREKLMQILAKEESFEMPKYYEILQAEAGDSITNINRYHTLDEEELCEELSNSTVSSEPPLYYQLDAPKCSQL